MEKRSQVEVTVSRAEVTSVLNRKDRRSSSRIFESVSCHKRLRNKRKCSSLDLFRLFRYFRLLRNLSFQPFQTRPIHISPYSESHQQSDAKIDQRICAE